MKYPLLLKFTGTTIGGGFIASVSFVGRFLGEKRDDVASGDAGDSPIWWLYGVNPSAIAECGNSLLEANDRLRDAIKESLAWFASEAQTFGAFKGMVEEFVRTTNEENLADWMQAVERVRAAKENLDDLPVWGAAMAVMVDVTRKREVELNATDNAPTAQLGAAKEAA